MLIKKCPICKEDKNIIDFHKDKTRKGGLQYSCKICNAKRAREYYKTHSYKESQSKRAKLRRLQLQDFVNEIKINTGCIYCGEKHPACLDFHHRLKDMKKFSISSAIIKHFSKEKILVEIKKCDIVCANCHRKLHNIKEKG